VLDLEAGKAKEVKQQDVDGDVKNYIMWKLTKQYLKDMWAYLLGKTEIDEKIIATAKDVNR
jgi:hypothetical protein